MSEVDRILGLYTREIYTEIYISWKKRQVSRICGRKKGIRRPCCLEFKMQPNNRRIPSFCLKHFPWGCMGQCICPEIQLQAAGLPLFSTHALSNVKPVLKPAWVRIKEGKTTRWSFFKKKLFLMRFYFNLYTFWDCILTRQHLCNCLGLFDNIFAVINDRIRLIEMLE